VKVAQVKPKVVRHQRKVRIGRAVKTSLEIRGNRMAVIGRIGVVALLLLAPLSCDRGSTENRSIRDLPVHEVVEDIRIGSHDDPDQALTSRGTSLPILPGTDGGVWVVQYDDQSLRHYDAQGSFVGRIGGAGEGPGEFGAISGLGWWRGTDTLWVSDFALRRVTLFGSDGTFVRTFAHPLVEHGDSLQVVLPYAFSPEGAGLAVVSSRPGVIYDGDLPIVRYDAERGVVQDEVGSLTEGLSVAIRWQGAPLASGMHPMSDAPISAFAPDGHRIVIVDRSTDQVSDPAVSAVALTYSGDTLWSRQFEYVPIPVAQNEVDSILEARIASFQRFTQLEGRLTDEQAAEAYRTSVQMPRHVPPIRAARLGLDGRTWLQWDAPAGVPSDVWILSPDGELLMALRPTQVLNILSVDGDYLWALELDELDVPFLVRYRIGERVASN
jgi:hypothetical protein